MRKLVVALFSLGLLASCTSTDSEFIDTDGITAIFDVEVTEQDGGATVWAILHQGDANSATYVKMSGGDKLNAAVLVANGQYTSDKEMDERAGLGATAYRADFSDFDDGGEEYKIEFDRSGSGNESALDSSVILPPKFEIASMGTCSDLDEDDECDVGSETPFPSTPPGFNRATDSLYFVFDNYDATAELVFSAEGSCIQSITTGLGVGGDGVDLIKGSLQSVAGQESTDCDVTLHFARKSTGTVDSAFMGGAFVATQIRSVTLPSLGQ